MAKKRAVRRAGRKVASRETRKAAKSSGKSGMGLAIVALILNVLILPGLGSLIGRKIRAGVWQIFLFLAAAILAGVFIVTYQLLLAGLFGLVMIAVWIWGIVTGVRLIQDVE